MLADSFRNFADWAVGTSPLYERLARGVADDPDLLALAETVPEGRSPPHLLLGSVHSLLLGGADHELAAFYDTVTESPLDPRESDPCRRSATSARFTRTRFTPCSGPGAPRPTPSDAVPLSSRRSRTSRRKRTGNRWRSWNSGRARV